MRLPTLITPCIAAICALAPAPPAQSTITLPRAAANQPGGWWLYNPWGWTNSGVPGFRSQTIYSSTELTLQGVQAPILIDCLRWRPSQYSRSVQGGQFQIAKLRLSASATGWNNLAPAFADNHGLDHKLVYDAQIDGPIIYQPTPGPMGWQPTSWCVDITLPRPFLYDPARGDLVVDVDHLSAGFQGSSVERMDAAPGSVSHIISSTTYPQPTTALSGHGAVVELGYTLAAGVHPVLAAEETVGPTPLTVQFRDLSFSSSPNGVTSWAWDFDNDGTIDSTLQNPSHTYTTCGTFDVSLTIDDGVNPPATTTEPSLIVTDETIAAFADVPIATRVVQFTDASEPPATAWAWDLDGDSVIDSTLRNPTYAYPTHEPVTVTLTTSRLCGASSTTSREVVPAHGIGGGFSITWLGAPGWTAMFDIDVTNPGGIDLAAIDVAQYSSPTGPFAVEIWLTGDGHAGKEAQPTAWRRIGTAIGRANNEFAQLAAPVHVPNGNYGIALHAPTLAPAASHVVGPTLAQNTDVVATFGTVRTTAPYHPFGPGINNTNVAWNGTLYYERCHETRRASHGFLGEGCPGTQPHATLRTVAPPELGSVAIVELDRLPTDSALMVVGFDNRNSPLGQLPLDLTSFGLIDCVLRVRPDATITLVGSHGRATWRLPIPNDPALTCVRMFQQAIVFDPGHNPAGAVVSDAAGLVIGR